MPIDNEGHFAYAKQEDLLVGERKFYLHEDIWDGTPSIRYALLGTRGNLFGLWKQSAFPKPSSHLRGSFIPMYDDSGLARREYIELAQWKLAHLHTDLDRPGDQIGIESVTRNVNHLLRTSWKSAIDKTVRELEEALKTIGLDCPPIQEFRIGDRVITVQGEEVVIAEATLWNGSLNYDTQEKNPPYIEYRDKRGITVEVLRAA